MKLCVFMAKRKLQKNDSQLREPFRSVLLLIHGIVSSLITRAKTFRIVFFLSLQEGSVPSQESRLYL